MKCYFPDLGCAFDCWGANFPHATTIQKYSPDLGNDLSPVWNFCTHDVSWRGGIANCHLPSQAMKKIIYLLIFVTNTIFGPLLGSLSGTDYSGYNACFTRIYWIHFQSLIMMERAVALLINLTITVQNGHKIKETHSLRSGGMHKIIKLVASEN